jgi:hypothetical protein
MTQSDIRALAELHLLCSHSLYWLPQLRRSPDIALQTANQKKIDREMYWTAFIAIGAVAAIVTRYAVQMGAKGDAWWNLLRFTILGLGALLFGVSLGSAWESLRAK